MQWGSVTCAVSWELLGQLSSPPADSHGGPVRLQKGLESLLLHGGSGARLGRELLLGMGTAETHEGNNNPTLKCVGSGDTDLTLSLV